MGYFLVAFGSFCTWFAPASDHRLIRALNRPRGAQRKKRRFLRKSARESRFRSGQRRCCVGASVSLPELGSALASKCEQLRRQALVDPTALNNQVNAHGAATALGAC